MTVSGMPVVCPNLNCNFNFIDSTPQVTSFSYSGNTLIVYGTDLPITDFTVEFALVECTVSSAIDTEIHCDTSDDLVTGSWLPVVRDLKGVVSIVGSPATHDVPISVTSVSPNTGLNPNGGNLLTISGSNFPLALGPYYTMSVVFDGGSSTCVVQSSSTSAITCLTEAFDAGQVGSGSVSMDIEINGIVDSA
mmetsp:Transcript_29263/g.28387  ORF Transcript_29263/g.28387 Transcript_29263/m.28387 type:complete len:192 (-) Transcript_29263:1089-1664(-)